MVKLYAGLNNICTGTKLLTFKFKQMKTKIIIVIVYVILSGCYQRIGDLTIMSNRNIDLKKNYVLLQRNVEGKARLKKNDALERAIDRATEQYNGEYLMNVKVFVKNNGRRVKIIGDVWGYR